MLGRDVARLEDGQRDVLADGERIEEGAGLEEHAETLADLGQPFVVELGDLGAVDENFARVGLERADDVAQEGTFAAAAAAHDDEDFAVLQLEGDVLQNLPRAEAAAHVAHLEGVGRLGLGGCGRRLAHKMKYTRVVKIASIASMQVSEVTTDFVVALPTPSAPPSTWMP